MVLTCSNCRHYYVSRYSGVDYCDHPDAKVFDRVHGYLSPPLSDDWPDAKLKTLAACDREGRFEAPPRPWWRFWP